MRTALAAVVLAVLVPGVAQAAPYQTGTLAYSASGSWTTVTRVTQTCTAPSGDDTVDERTFTARVVERGRFVTGRGIAHYEGYVGERPLFTSNGDRVARLRVAVTRTVERPVQCSPAPVEDCGSRVVRGIARSQFEAPVSSKFALDLRLGFGNVRYGPYLDDPFKTCGGDVPPILLQRVSRSTQSPDLQDAALRYPKSSTFWSRKRLNLSGTGRAKGIVFSMRLKTSRDTRSTRARQ